MVPGTAGIGVVPVTGGLDFNPGLIVGDNQSADVVIDYVVRSVAGGPITDSGLTIAAGASGTGAVAVDETQCLGGPIPCAGTTIGLHGTQTSLNDTATFGGQTEIGVIKDVGVTGGTDGQASVSAVTQTYSQGTSPVPEPASLTLFGIGLLGLAFFLRRKALSSR